MSAVLKLRRIVHTEPESVPFVRIGISWWIGISRNYMNTRSPPSFQVYVNTKSLFFLLSCLRPSWIFLCTPLSTSVSVFYLLSAPFLYTGPLKWCNFFSSKFAIWTLIRGSMSVFENNLCQVLTLELFVSQLAIPCMHFSCLCKTGKYKQCLTIFRVQIVLPTQWRWIPCEIR